MRKLTLAVIAVLIVVTAVVVVVVTRHREPTSDTSASAAPANPGSTTQSRVDGPTMQELLNTRLSTLGAELSVGLPATLTLDDVDGGKTVYVRVTMSELKQLPDDQADDLTQQRTALHEYSTVYAMPVTLTVLGIIDADGADTVPGAVLTATELGRFSIATHPGSEPLTSTPTMTSPSCSGAPQRVSIATNQKLAWCIHAFADDDSNTPTGGQYATSTGTYETPITWASKRYAAPTIP